MSGASSNTNENLPVATPIEATVVPAAYAASAPPMKQDQAYTKTTVYAPDGSVKHAYSNSTAIQMGSPRLPQSETFITHIPAQPNTTSTNRNVGEMLLPGFRRAPVRMECCPSCGQSTRTQTRTHPSLATWIGCIILLILFWPLCWIPLVCDVFKQTDHYCSSCGIKVAEVGPFHDCCEKRRG